MADAVTENPIILNIMDTYGAILLGLYFSCMTWGVSCMQFFLYFLNYEKDHLAIRLLVVTVWMIDTANQILLMKSAFPVLILHWGGVAGLGQTQTEIVHHMWVSGIVAVLVQAFFLWRIYVFSGNKWLFSAVMTPIILWQVVGAIPMTVTNLRNKSLDTVMQPQSVAFIESLRSVSAGVDVTIAISMAWLLVKNGNSHFTSSRKLVFRLMMLTINTGFWTAVCALMVLILVLVYPTTVWYCVFEFPLSGLYVNTLMANLNARRYISGGNEPEWNSHLTPSSGGRNVPLSHMNRRSELTASDNVVAVRVETSKAVRTDEDMKSHDHFKQML